jgi:hypothetical protein
MNLPTPSDSTQSIRHGLPFARARRKRYVDELMDHYVSWREACAAVAAAYDGWRPTEGMDREVAFTIYCSALDREEDAASAYQTAVARVAAA